MKKLLDWKWIKDMFSKEGELSSKRIIGACMIAWCLLASTYLILKDSQNIHSHSIIEFLGATGAGLISAGVVEAFKSNKKKNDGRDNKAAS